MQTHNVKSKTKRAVSRRVGRGGKRGKTAGRGTKGQNARAGRKKRPEMRDTIKKFPKRRGRGKQGLRTHQDPSAPVSLADIAAGFKAGETVSPKTLAERGMVAVRAGRYPAVKLLAGGEIAVAVTVEGCAVSAAAKVAIEKAGGSVVAVVKKLSARKSRGAARAEKVVAAKASAAARAAGSEGANA